MDRAQLTDYIFKTAAAAIARNKTFIANLVADGYAARTKFLDILEETMTFEFGGLPGFFEHKDTLLVGRTLLMEEAIKQAAAQGLISDEQKTSFLCKTYDKYPKVFNPENQDFSAFEARNRSCREGIVTAILNEVNLRKPTSKLGNAGIGFIEPSAALATMKGTILA